jgi:hypothetical protein
MCLLTDLPCAPAFVGLLGCCFIAACSGHCTFFFVEPALCRREQRGAHKAFAGPAVCSGALCAPYATIYCGVIVLSPSLSLCSIHVSWINHRPQAQAQAGPHGMAHRVAHDGSCEVAKHQVHL